MDSIKRLTTEALQEIEDGNGYEALRTIVAAVEELADQLEIVGQSDEETLRYLYGE